MFNTTITYQFINYQQGFDFTLTSRIKNKHEKNIKTSPFFFEQG